MLDDLSFELIDLVCRNTTQHNTTIAGLETLECTLEDIVHCGPLRRRFTSGTKGECPIVVLAKRQPAFFMMPYGGWGVGVGVVFLLDVSDV